MSPRQGGASSTPDRRSRDQTHSKYLRFLHFLFMSLGISIFSASAQAQGAGLYKDGQKVLDFEELISTSLDSPQKTAPSKATARKELLGQVLGEGGPASFKEQKEYVQTALKCRELVREILSSPDKNATTSSKIEQLAALGESLNNANVALLARFDEIETDIRSQGYPSEKVRRHTELVEHYRIRAERLRDLLARLRVSQGSGSQSAVWDVLKELDQYFQEGKFDEDPPLLNSQPLPIVVDRKEAPVVQRDELPLISPTTYPFISGWERGYDPEDLEETIDVQFTDEIIALAAELNHSPVEIYEYVRNNFTFEPYFGSRKGSQQTLSHMRGNDYDLASLLIALLRVSGIPARYARAEAVEMPIDRATNWLGFDDPINAANMLHTAGFDVVLVYSGPEPVAIRCKRVWAEAYVPYINYRGAINDSTGFMWVPLDPTFRQYNYKSAINLPAEIGFDAEAFINAYCTTFHEDPPVEMFKQMLLDSLAVLHPEATYEDLIRPRTLVEETDGIIPGTLPYIVLSMDTVFSEIPADTRYYIRFHVHGFGTDLDYTTSLPKIVQKQVTISYVGATPADQQIIDDAGGIFHVEYPYLVDLKPVLKIDGCEVARGSGSVTMGLTHYSDMHFTPPVGLWNGIPVVYNYIIAGNYQGIGIDTEDAFPAFFDVPETACEEEYLGQVLHQAALTYLNSVDVQGDEAADLMHIIVVNDVSEAIVENTVRVYFDGGGNPITFEWTGMIVDADRKIVGPFSVDGVDNSCDYMRLAGADASIKENRLFEDLFDEEAISTIKILELASDSGIAICYITTSIAADCPAINQPPHVISAINNCLSQGHHVTIPQREFTYYEWTGTGWICLDPVTCAAGYIISGGKSGEIHDGGETVQTWDITYPDLHCIEPIGPVTVSPASANGLYCAESGASWTFTVPTIKYWGKDTAGNCQLLHSEAKDFPVKYSIKEIADTWGPGEYIFEAGSNTTDCGCTMIQKTVTIVRIEFPSGDFVICKDGDRTMNVTISPASASAAVIFESANSTLATVSGSPPSLSVHGASKGQTSIQAKLNGVECQDKDVIVFELKSETVATTPADRARTTLGIGEDVSISTEPPVSVTWSVTGGGTVSPVVGSSTTLIASKSPSTSTVSASSDGHSCDIQFTVIKPNGMNCSSDHDIGCGVPGPPNNRIGASTLFNCTVLPTTVSFWRAEFRENIPGETWTWPDGTTGSHPKQIVNWSVSQANTTTDESTRCGDPIARLDAPPPGGGYVNFWYDIRVPEEYLNQAGVWTLWLPGENHPKEYRGSDAAARTFINATNSSHGGWQGPWR